MMKRTIHIKKGCVIIYEKILIVLMLLTTLILGACSNKNVSMSDLPIKISVNLGVFTVRCKTKARGSQGPPRARHIVPKCT